MTIQSKKLSSFCRTGSGGTPSRSNSKFFENGTIPWVKSGELKNRYITHVEEYITELAVEKSSAKLVSKGSLLIAMYGATVGEVSQLTFDATTNQAICNISPDENICDVNYLYRFLEASKPYLLSRRVGGGQPNISQGIIKDLEVPLPPLLEQRRIASILDKADELRQKRQQGIEKLDQLLQATFIDMFGDPVSNPKKWKLGLLGDLGELDRGVSKHRPRGAPELLGGIHPLIQTGDVARSQGYIRSYTSTYSDSGLAQSKKWMKGTLCITIAANIANTGILTFDACFPDSVVGFLPNQTSNTEYVQGLFLFFKQILEEKAPQSAQKNINLAILRALEVPIPPKDLQEKWSKVALSIEEQKQKLYKQLDIQNQLFSSLQNQTFSGNL